MPRERPRFRPGFLTHVHCRGTGLAGTCRDTAVRAPEFIATEVAPTLGRSPAARHRPAPAGV
ncbi:hypothetical protein [Streptomyces tendae]